MNVKIAYFFVHFTAWLSVDSFGGHLNWFFSFQEPQPLIQHLKIATIECFEFVTSAICLFLFFVFCFFFPLEITLILKFIVLAGRPKRRTKITKHQQQQKRIKNANN